MVTSCHHARSQAFLSISALGKGTNADLLPGIPSICTQ